MQCSHDCRYTVDLLMVDTGSDTERAALCTLEAANAPSSSIMDLSIMPGCRSSANIIDTHTHIPSSCCAPLTIQAKLGVEGCGATLSLQHAKASPRVRARRAVAKAVAASCGAGGVGVYSCCILCMWGGWGRGAYSCCMLCVGGIICTGRNRCWSRLLGAGAGGGGCAWVQIMVM